MRPFVSGCFPGSPTEVGLTGSAGSLLPCPGEACPHRRTEQLPVHGDRCGFQAVSRMCLRNQVVTALKTLWFCSWSQAWCSLRVRLP